jgi:hypothetical protein
MDSATVAGFKPTGSGWTWREQPPAATPAAAANVAKTHDRGKQGIARVPLANIIRSKEQQRRRRGVPWLAK